MTEGDKKFWKTAMKHADVQVERDSDAFHTSSRGSFTSTATMEEMRYEIKWLNALFAQVCSRSTHTAGVRGPLSPSLCIIQRSTLAELDRTMQWLGPNCAGHNGRFARRFVPALG